MLMLSIKRLLPAMPLFTDSNRITTPLIPEYALRSIVKQSAPTSPMHQSAAEGTNSIVDVKAVAKDPDPSSA